LVQQTAAADEAPFFADVADAPSGGVVRWLTAADGVRLRVGHWLPERAGGAKGTVILLPGRTEYIEKYGRAAADLGQRGFSCVVIDFRGQGLADRPLADRMTGHVGSFAEYQADLDAVMAYVEQAGLPRPLYMLAHSMGGSIGLRALMRGLPFSAAAFTGPMWGVSIAAWLRPLAQVISGLSGIVGMAHHYAPGQGPKTYVAEAAFAGNTLTTDREMWDYMRRQAQAHPELTLGGPSLGWLHAALADTAALSAMPSPRVPVICALGTAEKVVDTAPIHLRMAGWGTGQLDLYPGAEHEVLMERAATRKRAFDRAASLFEAHR